MYKIQLEWKKSEEGEWRVFLPDIEQVLRSEASETGYCGNTSDDGALTLWFEKDPQEKTKEKVMNLWSSLNKDDEKTKFKQELALIKAEKVAKTSLPFKSWDVLVAAEKKLVLNQALSLEDRKELLKKYGENDEVLK